MLKPVAAKARSLSHTSRTSGDANAHCEQVPPGTFLVAQTAGNKEGMDEMTYREAKCPAGKYRSASSGEVTCSSCGHGRVQPAEGQSLCEVCSLKQYIKVQMSPRSYVYPVQMYPRSDISLFLHSSSTNEPSSLIT